MGNEAPGLADTVKIGLVIYGSIDTVSGGYLYDRKLVEYLRSRRDEVQLLSLNPGRYFAHFLDNLVFRLPPGLDILIEDELVHASVLAANGLARRIHPSRSYPIISLIHNLHSSERRARWCNAFYGGIERQHLNSVEGFIFNSTITRDSVWHLVGDTKPYAIAPPGGDRFGTLAVEDVRERAKHGGPLRLLFLANVIALKGLDVLLDALARLPAGEFVLDVAGSLEVEPEYARRMQAAARRLPMPITFHGIVHGQALVDILRRTDVLVLPSFYEGFGIAYLEGMSHGAPAIGTNAGAIPQIISHGSNGFLIEPGDSTGLARHLESLGRDRGLLVRMSEGALKRFASFPTWEQSAERVRDFLLEMIASHGSEAARRVGQD